MKNVLRICGLMILFGFYSCESEKLEDGSADQADTRSAGEFIAFTYDQFILLPHANTEITAGGNQIRTSFYYSQNDLVTSLNSSQIGGTMKVSFTLNYADMRASKIVLSDVNEVYEYLLMGESSIPENVYETYSELIYNSMLVYDELMDSGLSPEEVLEVLPPITSEKIVFTSGFGGTATLATLRSQYCPDGYGYCEYLGSDCACLVGDYVCICTTTYDCIN